MSAYLCGRNFHRQLRANALPLGLRVVWPLPFGCTVAMVMDEAAQLWTTPAAAGTGPCGSPAPCPNARPSLPRPQSLKGPRSNVKVSKAMAEAIAAADEAVKGC